jgi:acyl carrier protein
MELEADLGIDTIKQATVLATLAEELGVGDLGEVRLFDYPTLRGLVDLFTGRHAGGRVASATADERAPVAESAPRAAGEAGQEEAAPGVAELVRAVVAQVTGYQVSMIEPSMELEADLGVDTVKQATILAMLGERFGVAPEAEFRISEFPTVNHLMAHFQGRALAAASPALRREPALARAAAPGPAAPAQGPMGADLVAAVPAAIAERAAPDRADVTQRLMALLVEQTPYPREMLEPDLTLESDLGLDAETREKLRSACVRAFGLPSDWRLPADARLDALAEELAQAERTGDPRQDGEAMELARQVRVLVPAPLSDGAESLAGKRVWVWGDDPACVQACAAAVANWAGEVDPWCFPASGSPEEAVAALSRLLQGPPPELLVDLTACGAKRSLLDATAEETPAIVARAADCRFAVWKRLAEAQRLPGRILAVTAIDGAHGLAGSSGLLDPVFGLHVGLYKALRRAWPERRLTILDLAPGLLSALGAPAVAAFELVLGELAGRGPGVEVCRVAGVRQRVVLEDAPVPVESARPGPDEVDEVDEVILATGGGSGITATILEHLVQGRPSRVALVGRTRLGPEAERFQALTPEARLREKESIRARLSRAGQRVTPVMVEEAWAALQRGAEILETLSRLQAAGCRATYHAADVADRAQLAAALDEARRVHGPITTLIHGAGREVSRALERKSLEEFQSVHRVKTLGACHLSALCQGDPLRRVVAVSSIAGLLGSAAQIDYSAANAFLDLWARAWRGRRGIVGTSLVWSGWAERGMAWRNGFLRENAERAGLNFIPPDEGGRAAARELRSSGADVEVVIHRGLGELLDPELAASSLEASPMIDWVSRGAGLFPTVHRRYSAQRDAILDQHRLAGTPLMPGVGFMELLAEAHRWITGEGAGPLVFRQLAFRDAFKLYRDGARDVMVRSALAAAAPNAGGCQALRMEVWSSFRPRAGGAAEQRLYCGAVVSREAVPLPAESPTSWDLGGEERSDWAKLLAADQGLEKNVVFGPIFNDARRSGHSVAELEVVHGKAGLWARAPLPRAQRSEPRYPLDRFLINPAFLDSMHQAGAVFCILQTGQIYLPVGAERFVIFTPPREEGQYDVIARVSDRSQDHVLFDIAMLRDRHELCCLAQNVVFRRIRQ